MLIRIFMTRYSQIKNKKNFRGIKKLVTEKSILVFLLLLSAFIFQNCEKDPDKVGSEIIPESDKLNVAYSDTASLRAYSIRSDSVRTDETSRNLLGSYKDAVFGKTTASFFTQLRLSSVNPDFGPNPVLDSLVLTLDYSGYYGDTNTALQLHVYELSEQMYKDSVYYSNQSIPQEDIDYANMQFYPRPKTPTYPNSDTLAEPARLSINLSNYYPDLGNKILTADSASLADNENFLEYLKGLYVTVDAVASGGSIIYFDLESALSNLSLYYHNDTLDSLSYLLNINENCARFTHFDHNDYADADEQFKQQVLNQDTALGKEILYLQSMAGIRTKIFFPYIKNWFETEKILVNEATLKVYLQDGQQELFKPDKLTLYKFVESGGLTFLEDEYEGAEYFGGYYDSLNQNYSFRITRHIQHLMMGTEVDYGLALNIEAAYNNAYHLILNGTENESISGNKMLLELRYTILE